jgi:hypothetical protein
MGFESLEAYLMDHARPSIRVYTERVEDENSIPLGSSKIGGRPDLPRDMEWATATYSDKTISLLFVAQFDLAELKPYDEENLLPESGILYFFATRPWDDEKARLIYFDGDRSLLERKEFPEDIPPTRPREWGDRFDACTVTFVPEVNIAGSMEPNLPEGRTMGDFYNLEVITSYVEPQSSSGRFVNRLLGYNYGIPPDMQLDCQMISENLDPHSPDTYKTLTPEKRRELEQLKGNWQLLFQMDSDENAGMMWSDAGVICFYIRRQDLQIRDFSKVCLAFFSG